MVPNEVKSIHLQEGNVIVQNGAYYLLTKDGNGYPDLMECISLKKDKEAKTKAKELIAQLGDKALDDNLTTHQILQELKNILN